MQTVQDFKYDLGNRLHEIRKSNDLSQEKLAEYLGVTHKTISNYESGKTTLPPEKAMILHKRFQLSFDYIYAVNKDDELEEAFAIIDKKVRNLKILKIVK